LSLSELTDVRTVRVSLRLRKMRKTLDAERQSTDLTAMSLRVQVFWDVTICRWVNGCGASKDVHGVVFGVK